MTDFIPNSFQCPNVLIDKLMRVLTPNEFKCLVLVLRKTRGWNKDVDGISVAQFMEFTGIRDRKTIYAALDSLVKRGLLQVKKTGGRINLYQLSKLFYQGDSLPVDKPVPKNGTSTKKPHQPVPKNGTSTSTKKRYSTKNNKKQINKKQPVDNFPNNWDNPNERIKPVPPMPKTDDLELIHWAEQNGFNRPISGESWYEYRRRLTNQLHEHQQREMAQMQFTGPLQ